MKMYDRKELKLFANLRPAICFKQLVDASTLKRARLKNLNPIQYLRNNDSHNYFKQLGDLVYTGPTGTNVNDVMIIVNLPHSPKENKS